MVDPAESAPVLEALTVHGWKLDFIFNTHHHPDHVGANTALKKETGCEIVGFADDAARIPGITRRVREGDRVRLGEAKAEVIFIPGHTLGHIAYYFAKEKALFCGDTIFSLGCGRLFEGTPAQMFSSLQRLAALPGDTQIYCAHEYTESNGCFALTIEPENKTLKERMEEVRHLREEDKPTVPSTLAMELATNPFLRAKTVEEFARIRALKDNFR